MTEDPPEPTRDDASSTASLKALQLVAGLFAGAAALIYITGGLILGLRLLFAGLPALGVVGQLPREFLFSLGVSLVVVPAALIGAASGVIEMGQGDVGLCRGHQSWSWVKERKRLRQTYIAFYSVAPILLLSPGLVVAVLRDDDIEDDQLVAGVVIAATVIELAIWATFARRSRMKTRDDEPSPDAPHRLAPLEWASIFSGALLCVAFAAWVGHWVVGSAKYLPVLAAWTVGLLTALLVIWIRGQVGKRYRPPGARNKVALAFLSWIASAILVVPAFVAVAAAWPLANAVLCSAPTDSTAHPVVGDFVGEGKDHTYIGAGGQIVSVPNDKVTRLTVGEAATDDRICLNDTNASTTTRPNQKRRKIPPDGSATVAPPKIPGLLRQTVQIDHAGRILVRLRPFSEEVTGVAQLVSVPPVPAAGGRRLKISTHAFRADPGASVSIRFALSAAALHFVRGRGRMRVSARISARGMLGAAQTIRPRLTITAPVAR